MLLSGQLLQQVVVGGVGGELTLGQSVSQPVLVGKEQPDLPSPAFRNTCTQRDTQTIIEDQRTAKTHKLNYFWLILGRLHNNFEALRRTYDLSYTGPDSTLCPIKTHTHTYTSLTLAESTVQLLFVLWDRHPAWSRQFSLPQCQRVFGALAHFLVVQLHLADVQLVSAGCDTVGRTKKTK